MEMLAGRRLELALLGIRMSQQQTCRIFQQFFDATTELPLPCVDQTVNLDQAPGTIHSQDQRPTVTAIGRS